MVGDISIASEILGFLLVFGFFANRLGWLT